MQNNACTPPQHALLSKQRLKQTVILFFLNPSGPFSKKKKIQKFIFSRCIISIKFTGINNGASAFHFLINAHNFV